MNNIDNSVKEMLDNLSDNSKIIKESKKNIYTKLTIVLLSALTATLSSLIRIGFAFPVILLSAGLAFIIPQLITIKMQGTYYKNIKNIINSKKDMEKHLEQYRKEKDIKKVKEKVKIDQTEEEIDRHNLRQKELEMVFSDENYYPYIEQIKAKTLKK